MQDLRLSQVYHAAPCVSNLVWELSALSSLNERAITRTNA